MRCAALLLPLLLAACGDPNVHAAEQAEKEAELVAKNGTSSEECEAYRAVEDAWRKALDQQKYEQWKLKASAACLSAQLDI